MSSRDQTREFFRPGKSREVQRITVPKKSSVSYFLFKQTKEALADIPPRQAR
jgi:hypothetical protein